MHTYNNSLWFSPTDLTRYMESPFASWMDRGAWHKPELRSLGDPADSLMHVLKDRGFAHEQLLLEDFYAQGLSVIEIDAPDIAVRHQQTLDALRSGADVVAQAYLTQQPFAGYADFLVKVPGQSALGDYHYEVWDAKLAQSARAAFYMQLACYADMLFDIQQRHAEYLTVAVGSGELVRVPSRQSRHYYSVLKQSFLRFQAHFDPHTPADPAHSANWLNWSTEAERQLCERDHLFQVATITRGQMKHLQAAQIGTMQALAESAEASVSGIQTSVFQRLQQQARLQIQSRGQARPAYQVLSVPTEQAGQAIGLAMLPPHSPLDIFFDIEGNPLAEGGLEYLWGASYFEADGTRQFKDFWGHNAKQEKQAFIGFVHWAYQRWQQDPGMHIYHYANYEVAACRKLMGRYAVCEHEVDQLLRNEVFVDLYTVVRNGLLVGEPRYSIKNIENLYRPKRDTDVASGGESVVVYEQWRELHAAGEQGGSWQDSDILNSIREYNIDDCDSTQELVDWLRERQAEHGISYLGKTETEDLELSESVAERLQLSEQLLSKAESLREMNPANAKVHEIFAWAIEFHRREMKPMYWRRFDRLGQTHQELLEDPDCLGCCQRSSEPPFKHTPRARNSTYTYQFNTHQEFKPAIGSYFLLGEETKVKLLESSELERGHLHLQCAIEPPAFISLIPDELVSPDPIPAAIHKVAERFLSESTQQSAISDFLQRKNPRIKNHNEAAIVSAENADQRLQQTIHAIHNLNNSYLPIQGPPGTGKTYTASRVIASLLQQGAKVGISSNSHKAINNLLINTASFCQATSVAARFACTRDTDDQLQALGVQILKNSGLPDFIQNASVVGTTAWGFSRDDMADQLDYLFVDEAGQVSTANLIGMSRCARNIVLLGDQMQLGQPLQGSHPGESGLSVLDYLLHEESTITEQQGIFLNRTYRMHSALNEFVSQQFYNGKLLSDPDNDQRWISTYGAVQKNAGVQFVPVQHEGNAQYAPEEVQRIQELLHDLLQCTVHDNGAQRPLQLDDVLFVAPYNHQVSKLQQALGPAAKVGSVDKFQGQQAPVVILSMCASNANDSPRGLDFLFDNQRLNVAISRAQCLAFVVANPALALTSVGSVQQMKQVDLFCALMQQGAGA
ncbi:MAG: TM0106 family RecB-like putative nuclease [Pseudomonadales bacterium]